jgi:hypothetical protein
LSPIIPTRKKTRIANDIGLTGPSAVDSGRRPPMIASVTSTITSAASSSGLLSVASDESGVRWRDVASSSTRTSVCIAIPPSRLPVASARCPLSAADAVIASSGNEPASPSRSMPPTAWPRLKRSSSTSVAFDR